MVVQMSRIRDKDFQVFQNILRRQKVKLLFWSVLRQVLIWIKAKRRLYLEICFRHCKVQKSCARQCHCKLVYETRSKPTAFSKGAIPVGCQKGSAVQGTYRL